MLLWAPVVALAALHPLEERGFDQLFNLDYAAARATFRQLSREVPDSASGPHYLASVIWLEELTRRGALAGETFQSARYWTRTRLEPVPIAIQKEFSLQVAESKRRSQARLKVDANDKDALYFLGATESVVSGYEATLNRSFFGAYLAGRRARNFHERLIAIDPKDADAYLVPGLFDYTVATLPRTTQLLAFLLGERGSKEKGLAYLTKAAAEGKRARWDAKLLLAVVREREKRYAEALTALREFETAFPRNPLYPLERGWVELLQKNWAAARATFETVAVRRERGIPNYDRVHASAVYLRIGESLLFARRFDEAGSTFAKALTVPEAPVELQAALHLRRGQAWDGLEDRSRAKADYLETIRLNVDRASVSAAREYLKTPFRAAW